VILRFTRTWLPAIVVAVGVILWVIDPTVDTAEGSAGIIGAGLSIWLLNFLYRVGVQGDRERQTEDEARDYLERHGHWPDEPPPTRSPRHRRPRD
jgi:hypothetical protein